MEPILFLICIIVIFSLFGWLAIAYDSKYKSGTITYKSLDKYYDSQRNEYKNYHIHCVVPEDGNKNYKLNVTEELYNKLEVGNLFPVKF